MIGICAVLFIGYWYYMCRVMQNLLRDVERRIRALRSMPPGRERRFVHSQHPRFDSFVRSIKPASRRMVPCVNAVLLSIWNVILIEEQPPHTMAGRCADRGEGLPGLFGGFLNADIPVYGRYRLHLLDLTHILL